MPGFCCPCWLLCKKWHTKQKKKYIIQISSNDDSPLHYQQHEIAYVSQWGSTYIFLCLDFINNMMGISFASGVVSLYLWLTFISVIYYSIRKCVLTDELIKPQFILMWKLIFCSLSEWVLSWNLKQCTKIQIFKIQICSFALIVHTEKILKQIFSQFLN